MTKNKEQKLDLRILNDVHKEQSKKREVKIPVTIEGKTQMTVLEIDEVFSPSKIRNCVEEFVSRADALRKMNEHRLVEVMQGFLIFQIIKHFTSFPAPDTYLEQVVVINMLMETGLIYRIYAEFDAKELEKVTEEISFIADKLEGDVGELVGYAEGLGIGTEEGGELVEKLQ